MHWFSFIGGYVTGMLITFGVIWFGGRLATYRGRH